MDPVPISQLVVELIKIIGVGNFVIVVLLLAVVVNAPNIINQIVRKISNNKTEKDTLQTVGKIDKSLDIIIKNNDDLVKGSASISKDLASLEKIDQAINRHGSERRLENSLIAENLSKLSFALSSIERMMRNVISEEDALRIANITLGITVSLKSDLMRRVLDTVEKLKDTKTGHLTYDLTSDINSAWSDFKNNLSSFNMPVKLKEFLEDYNKKFWEEGQIFNKILNVATSDLEIKNMKETISKTIDTGLRSLYSDLINYLEYNGRKRK